MIAATPAELKWLCHTARDQPRGAVRPTVTGYDDVSFISAIIQDSGHFRGETPTASAMYATSDTLFHFPGSPVRNSTIFPVFLASSCRLP